jgi:2-polyprenyl-3-methyl-5-hydroxy-6-metoxy-1,4-benzoquinol methylase
MADLTDIRETVREKYAAAARAAGQARTDPAAGAGCCGGGGVSCSPADATGVFGGTLYNESALTGAPESALSTSLGCGVPTAVADLREGETVLDLGSGGGADVLISARRVGPTGRAIGLDMTDEMLELARANAAQAGVGNVEFLKGYLEQIPLPDASVDLVISNCVINLVGDKPRVIREAARMLRAGGRFAVSDVIADPDMDAQTRGPPGRGASPARSPRPSSETRSSGPGSSKSRSGRLIAYTSTPPPRSSARASRDKLPTAAA